MGEIIEGLLAVLLLILIAVVVAAAAIFGIGCLVRLTTWTYQWAS